jgi:hypothetical protein
VASAAIHRSRRKTSLHFQLIINTKKKYNIVNRRTLVLACVPENLKKTLFFQTEPRLPRRPFILDEIHVEEL